jgi:hypothetical protein
LRLKLAYDGTPSITILRHPQEDLSMTLDTRQVPFSADSMVALHAGIAGSQTKRTFQFYNAEDLHKFTFAITGFETMYDGIARDFAISRRRAVTALSKNKRLETGLSRIMVVSHDNGKIVQLLAFFEDGNGWAESLGLVLKGVDVFERYDIKGKVGVRLVDAKFTIPRVERPARGDPWKEEEIAKNWVCLDVPETPGENDDIWIGFDDGDGKFFTFLNIEQETNKCRTRDISKGTAGTSNQYDRRNGWSV